MWGAPAALAAASTLLMLGGERWQQALRYDRAAVAAGQWWRLLSGNLVHLSWWHLLFNVLSLALLVLLCPERLPAAEWLRRFTALGAGMSLGLFWLSPGVRDYVGLSGLVYGLFALGFGRQALRRDEIGIACLVFILVRIGWELWVGASASEVRLIGGQVVPQSHLYGVASAALYALGAWVAGAWMEKGFKFGDRSQ
ncbi:MAG: rhombosortase [Nevskia sp.]|nr:rhombosortase [Nevskia sp.]